MKYLFAILIVACSLVVCAQAQAQVVNWRLDYQCETPKAIQVRVGGEMQNFFYVPYTITNNSAVDVDVSLLFYIATDTGKDYSDVLNPIAERAIIIREAKLEEAEDVSASIAALKDEKKYLNRNEISEKIPVGESWHGIAIFNEIDANMDHMVLQIGGLANIVRVKRKETVRVVEVLRMYYERPGDEFEVGRDRIVHNKVYDKWVEVAEFSDTRVDKAGVEEEWIKTKWHD